MSVTILQALQNANYNIQNIGSLGVAMGKKQLSNAVGLLEKGYALEDHIEPLIEKYRSMENIPEKGGNDL